jgi:hypothetical protein
VEERAYSEAQRVGVSLYAPLIAWDAPEAPAAAAASAAAAAAAAALLGQPCGFPTPEEAAKKGYVCTYHSAPGQRAQCGGCAARLHHQCAKLARH